MADPLAHTTYQRRYKVAFSPDPGRKMINITLESGPALKKGRLSRVELQGEAQSLAQLLEAYASTVFVAELYKALGEVLGPAQDRG